MRRPYCVGMTGGIGSGKSLAAEYFAGLGAEVIDTDQIARQLTAPHGDAMSAIVKAFGPGVCAMDGGLDRAAMRDLVFSDSGARQRLEAILHPPIREQAEKLIRASRRAYAIVVVPLLLETGAYERLLDRVLVVDCPETLQVERAVARSGLDPAMVQRVMASQISRSARLAAADDVIDNSGDVAQLQRQVGQLHEKYLRLAREMQP